MKLRLFVTHTLVLVVGAIAMACYFVFSVLPRSSNYIPFPDSPYIQLSGETKPVPYLGILRQRYLSNLYQGSPFYFFKRKAGRDIDETLSEQGYVPATEDMFTHYFFKASNLSLDEETQKYNFDKAHKWAKLAEEQGSYLPMVLMINILDLGKTKDITKELAEIENYAKTSSIGGPAEILSGYFAKHGNKEKAAYYKQLAKKIDNEHRPQPACTTITPWKGW